MTEEEQENNEVEEPGDPPGQTPAVESEAGSTLPSSDPDPGWYPDPEKPGTGSLRYWDGADWTDHRSASGGQFAPPPGFSTTRVDDEERRSLLAQQIQSAAVRGLRVESQDRYQAVLIEGHPVNHTLHAILTIFTCGVWGIVWAVIAATGGETRHLITVDEYGNVTHQNLGKS